MNSIVLLVGNRDMNRIVWWSVCFGSGHSDSELSVTERCLRGRCETERSVRGAGDGNRTRLSTLGRSRSTNELHRRGVAEFRLAGESDGTFHAAQRKCGVHGGYRKPSRLDQGCGCRERP